MSEAATLVKALAIELGADFVGIASRDRFEGAQDHPSINERSTNG